VGKRKSDSVSKQRYYRLWFQNLAGFVDEGARKLSRSELVTYLILLRDTRPNGTARAGLNDLAERGGLSRKSASRAVGSLIGKGVLRIVRRGTPGKATLYTIFPEAAFAELNPVAAQWLLDGKGTDVRE
jgi:DNA-binding MarR family transcriptional regulator